MRSAREETVAVRTTPPGAGGIAVVEVLGPDARRVVERFVRLTAGRPMRGRIADDVVACFIPRATTGEPSVEIGCHGNDLAVAAVVKALGVRAVERAFVLDRAVERRRLDRTRAEAYALLPGALTERAARMLVDQAEGALARARGREALLATAALGLGLVTPRRVVIAGRPNAGKSTLFNALVGRERALVSPEPHATRDPVVETIAIDGVPLVLADTAGLADARGPIDAVAMERAREELVGADLVLRVDDGTGAPEIAGALDVRTKVDLVPAPGGVSAMTGEGLDGLAKRILRALGLQGRLKAGAACVFTERQRRALEEGGRKWRERLLWGR